MEKNIGCRLGLRAVRWLLFALVVLVIVFTCTGTGLTQHSAPRRARVSGEVISEDPLLPNDLVVELYDMGHHDLAGRTPISPNGRFEFNNVESGFYKLRITDLRGDPIREEFVNVQAYGFPIQIRLRPRAPARPRGGTVSIQELRSTKHRARGSESAEPTKWYRRFWAGIGRAFNVLLGDNTPE